MWSYRTYLALTCLAAALSYAPSVDGGVTSGLLSDLIDRSICKTEVFYNENEKRIPQVIKEVKCAANPDVMCAAENDKQAPCCSRNSDDRMAFECEEVLDRVLVKYGDNEDTYETVAVGCACISHKILMAEEVSSSAK